MYTACFHPAVTRTGERKIPLTLRINESLRSKLRERSAVSGLTETRIVHDALVAYFSRPISERIREREATEASGRTEDTNRIALDAAREQRRKVAQRDSPRSGADRRPALPIEGQPR
jgi:hypothetical protein